MGLIEKLQAKLELYRLEQRYARRKHRTTFTEVQYVDGEYVYAGSSSNSSSGTVSKQSTGSWKSWGSSSSDPRAR
ncbi:hypothetical protein BDW69DRAFT_154095 [Aspergillus filifer]